MVQAPVVPSYVELLWPTLRAIRAIGDSGSIEEIVEKVIELEGFTEEQQSVLHVDGPGSEIQYRLAWTRTYLKRESPVVSLDSREPALEESSGGGEGADMPRDQRSRRPWRLPPQLVYVNGPGQSYKRFRVPRSAGRAPPRCTARVHATPRGANT